eukprot:CAMPEP_0172668424 /NCGR_PEP_ID=MMETSP1074-20121228/9054_1 /TAXON_ID=2916 /ORGANISM="Ceratium fusus, Strain PA161109" /LENGTH=33 /DNA_ID= /DNA_START= /DNA_END= /DNA_ORIENTATION=
MAGNAPAFATAAAAVALFAACAALPALQLNRFP